MTQDVNLAGAAALMHRSYCGFQRQWRTLRHPATGELFPRPYQGAEPGQRPWWRVAAIESWKDGAVAGAAPASASTCVNPAQREPANDPVAPPITDRVAALLQAAGS